MYKMQQCLFLLSSIGEISFREIFGYSTLEIIRRYLSVLMALGEGLSTISILMINRQRC